MFSVVIPLWNKRDTIAATVASALAQTHRDFELVIVDDGSSDGSPDALADFADDRLRLISQPHAGPGSARNAGIEASLGDWIAFLDADDLWLSHHLAELDRIRLAHPEAGLIGTAYGLSIRGKSSQPPRVPKPSIGPVNFFERTGVGARPFCTSSSAIPRSTYVELGGFGPMPQGQDSEYFARIALNRPVAASSRVTAIYRVGTSGISDRAARENLGPIASLRDLGPSVALVIDHYPTIECSKMRDAVDRYIQFQYFARLRKSARIGDFRALRSLPRLRPHRSSPMELLILIVALMPAPVARATYFLGYRIVRMLRVVAARVR